MDQLDCSAEDWSSSSIFTHLHSFFENNPVVNNLISQIQTMMTGEQLSSSPVEINNDQATGDLDESRDSFNQLEDCSPPTDISSALKSVALMYTLDLKETHLPVLKMFSIPQLEEEDETSPPEENQEESTEEVTDQAEEEVLSLSFHSKYFNFFPLYQDYCLQDVKDNLHRLSESFVSELISPKYLQAVQSRLLTSDYESESPELKASTATTSSLATQPIRVTPCSLWQDLAEVKASGLVSKLTMREIRLQESMFELMGSEASYLRSLGVAVNHFYGSKELKRILSRMEHHILFSNIPRVMVASEKFLMALEIRLGESVVISEVGDIVLQHCSEFHSLYVPYVTNMMYQEALLNRLLQQNRNVLYCIKKLESDAVCQRQRLKSFLVLPFQRITRIKLILESILKLTKPDSDSILNLEKAIEAIHQIVTECDRGVQKMRQIEELVCLEMLLDFGKVKSIPLVVNGRFLVHQGPLKKLNVEVSHRTKMLFVNIYLHLFNDLLIISSERDQRFTVMDHAKFPAHVHLEPLKAEVLGLPPDSLLLHLSQSQTGKPSAMIILPHTRSDKEAWVKALSSKH